MIELPKDAEGRDIPLDTKRLYNADGVPVGIRAFGRVWNPKDDSAEIHAARQLGEDLSRAAERNAVVSCCRYLTADKCANCPIHGNADGCSHKEERAFGDILDRIHKLRGGDE